MPIQFILGRSGTGKSTLCTAQITDALLNSPSSDKPLILLVPEQATYQAERSILSDPHIKGFSRLQILSFDRLNFLLRNRFSQSCQISRIAQQMLISSLLSDNSAEMSVFKNSAAQPGLADKITNIIIEMHNYLKDPEDIEKLIVELKKDPNSQLTTHKLSDIKLIYQKYLEFLKTNQLINPDYQLTAAIKNISSANFLKNAKLWVDGFADFTLQELTVLTEVLKHVDSAKIALCLDPDNIDLDTGLLKNIDYLNLFNPTEQTYFRLIEYITKQLKLQIEKSVILKQTHRFKNSPVLAHIEKNIFNYNAAKIGTDNSVRIIPLNDHRAEAEYVAAEIQKLIRQKNYRFRNIAVVASDIDQYRHFIQACFTDNNIPFFIDRRTPLQQHPLLELITSAFDTVLNDFSTKDILAFLKTDLLDIDRTDVDTLENYCLAFGIKNSDWKNPDFWNFSSKKPDTYDHQQIDNIRRLATKPLFELHNKLNTENLTVENFTDILFNFLESLNIPQKLEATDDAQNTNKQFYQQLTDILTQAALVFTNKTFIPSKLIQIFYHALDQISLAFIPPTIDQVLVGSIERSRHPNLKAVFLIGASQKSFPIPISSDSILTESDRKMLDAKDFQLARPASTQLIDRQYLAYIAFTRPSEHLYITYPLTDDKGSQIQPSQFISSLENLFTSLTTYNSQLTTDKIYTESQLTDFLCENLGKDNLNKPRQTKLLKDLRSEKKLKHITDITNSALNYSNTASLDKDFISQNLKNSFNTSASRLTSFASCSFQYFAKYTLKLDLRQIMQFQAIDIGTFYHNILDQFIKTAVKDNIDLATIPEDRLLKLLSDTIEQILKTDKQIQNILTHSAHNAYIINTAYDILSDTVKAIAQLLKASDFKPMRTEQPFGFDNKESQPVYKFNITDNVAVNLRGYIDRLDIAKIDNQTLALVFDYKLTSRNFSFSKFYHGLDLQMPLYLLVLKNNDYIPAGAFYFPTKINTVEDSDKFQFKAKGIFNADYVQNIDKQTTSNYSPYYNFSYTKNEGLLGRYNTSGILKPEHFDLLLNFAQHKIKQLCTEIINGSIAINPYRLNNYSPCSNCDYRSLCRFDWHYNDYNFLESDDKQTTLEKMETGIA